LKVVAVFGGGGAKSIACAGAWRALSEAGLTPSHLVGTSMGAVIAAAFASGATYDEVVIAGRSLSQRDVARVDPLALVKGAFATHLLKPAGLRGVIERFVPATQFGQLRIPLTITATDLDSGELVLFGPHPLTPSPLRGEGEPRGDLASPTRSRARVLLSGEANHLESRREARE